MEYVSPVRTLALVALAAFGLCVAQANAQTPGDSGQIDQYTESIPGAGGNEPTGGGGSSGGGGDDEPVLTPEQNQALESQGTDGAGVANLAEATSPPVDGGGSGSGGDGGSSAGSPAGEPDSSSPDSTSGGLVGAVDAVSGSDDGLGIVLPLILATVAVAGVVVVLRRRARQTT